MSAGDFFGGGAVFLNSANEQIPFATPGSSPDFTSLTPSLGSTSPFSGSMGQMAVGLIMFAAVMYAVYLVYKYLLPGKNFKKNRNMKVLEITSVGPGSTIQLVKVSEEYFLIGVTRNQITFLTKADGTGFCEGGEGEPSGLPFEKYLSRFIKQKNAPKPENNEHKDAGENIIE